MHSQDFSTQIIRIRRRLLRAPRRTPRPPVMRRISVRSERIRVVARGQIQISLRVEVQRSTRMTALLTLRGDTKNDLLRIHLELSIVERETRDHILAGLRAVGCL